MRLRRFKSMTSYEYRKLLRHPQWLRVRADILRRDKHRYKKCGYKGKLLHVHHKRYNDGLP